jgi:hypothetical protein
MGQFKQTFLSPNTYTAPPPCSSAQLGLVPFPMPLAKSLAIMLSLLPNHGLEAKLLPV